MLTVLDEKWKDHLYDLDQLRNAIQYRAWGQKDPLVEYKKEAFEMFEDLMQRHPGHLHRAVPQDPGVRRAAPAPPPPRAAGTAAPRPAAADDLFTGAPTPPAPPRPAPRAARRRRCGTSRRAAAAAGAATCPEVGRNDPCPCGSGKKYKKCHGAGR